mmetsp:Transcript_20874/g.37591  ORF Transcript_20874/g.37591 Transcript_20874/m.37591 type:complete len:97 (+) Transcript_20874:136-426(+)
MLGMMSHPHHEQFVPRFCKNYADVGTAIRKGLDAYKADVEAGTFPTEEYSPYKISEKEEAIFMELVEPDKSDIKQKLSDTSKKLIEADEYETIKVY